MSVKYKLLEDCKYGLKGGIITVTAPSRLRDMGRGMGEVYVEPSKPKPEPKPEPVIKVEKELKPKLVPVKVEEKVIIKKIEVSEVKVNSKPKSKFSRKK